MSTDESARFSRPTWTSHGYAFEDFTVGQTIVHHWGRTIGESDHSVFTAATLTHNPIYFNRPYARTMGYEGIVVNPMYVASLVCGLTVADLSERGGVFLEVRSMRFLRPVYIGDTIRARSTVRTTRPSGSRPGYGVVTWFIEGIDDQDNTVIDFERTNLIPGRDIVVEST